MRRDKTAKVVETFNVFQLLSTLSLIVIIVIIKTSWHFSMDEKYGPLLLLLVSYHRRMWTSSSQLVHVCSWTWLWWIR